MAKEKAKGGAPVPKKEKTLNYDPNAKSPKNVNTSQKNKIQPNKPQ